LLSRIFGSGKGSGIAVMFFITGVVGSVISFLAMRNPLYKSLDAE